MAPGRVTSSRLGPGLLMTSGWSLMMIFVTSIITVPTMAIGPPSPGWAVGPGGSIHHRHSRWHSLAGLLVGSLGRGGCFVLSCRVVLLPGRPIIFSLNGGAWSPSLGACTSMESSLELCALFAAAASASVWEPCQAPPTLPGANLYTRHTEILSYTTSLIDDIVDSNDGCHCDF